ncbi:aminotransferase class V-fold PLP-dependent enzyme [Desertivirga xinjiangensis]|uniref:aminotransferase class V-fold PLP-dependent enzyme n=1 Tax=Desertivirga xinjiangensis TaxID=539206 RepID=UPI00210904F8|nr:aminotransferase class V-fold PLP-dependent enzyme [Pedobacter xinjiangensis]
MHSNEILFHKPYLPQEALQMMQDALKPNNSLFKGKYHTLNQQLIKRTYKSQEVVFTSSCTDALNLASLLLKLQAGDEVIVPSYTFPSVANVFANRGIGIKLADSLAHHPNLDARHARTLINDKTRAIIFMSYGGQAEGIEEAARLAKEAGIFLIEDAAHSFDSMHERKHLGSIGDVAAFSFHESKSVSCGQGGMLLINNPALLDELKSVVSHGTNKWQLDKGLTTEYNWTSLGAEFNLSELNHALLQSQFKEADIIQAERKKIWFRYYGQLEELCRTSLKFPIQAFPDSNFYIFYILTTNKQERQQLIAFLKNRNISAAFHYTGLHKSDYYRKHFGSVYLPQADKFSDRLLRLPLYPGLGENETDQICLSIRTFYNQ